MLLLGLGAFVTNLKEVMTRTGQAGQELVMIRLITKASRLLLFVKSINFVF
jgi:hypothetical protein